MKKLLCAVVLAGLAATAFAEPSLYSARRGGGGVNSLSDLGDFCGANELAVRNGGDTAWVCATNASGGASTAGGYWTKTAEGGLSNEFAMGGLGTGAVINTTTTGVPTIYAGAACTSQFVRGLSASIGLTCNTVGTADVASGITLDTEWDQAAKINAATTDDDFLTLTGTETATNKSFTAPNLTGKVDFNNSPVSDDDCTGEQGKMWYDDTDSAFEFCNANSGAPTVLGGGAGSNTFGTFAVSGQSDVVADSTTDTMTLVAGSNITITTNAGTDTITIAASGSTGYGTVQEEGSGITQRAIINFVGGGFTAADDAGNTRTNVSLDATLNALAAYNTNGLIAQTAADTFAGRSVAEGLGIDVTNGDGVSGNPTVAFDPTELNGSRTFGDASTDTIVWTWNRSTGTDPTLTFGSGTITSNSDIIVPDEAYDASGWNGDLSAPTKNAVRDILETFVAITDPNANTLLGWDDTDGTPVNITIGSGLSYDHGTHTLSSSGSTGYATVQEDGSGLTQRATINFIGGAITCADNAGATKTDCTMDTDVSALAGNSTDGFWAHTGAGTGSARTLTEGLAIDITNPAGIAGNPTFAFDPTELTGSRTFSDGSTDTFVWTFDRATGTDPTMTIGNGVVNFSGLQEAGNDVFTTGAGEINAVAAKTTPTTSDLLLIEDAAASNAKKKSTIDQVHAANDARTKVFTNTTVDAAATGNVVKTKKYTQMLHPHLVDGTGCTIGTTATAIGYGRPTCSNSADQAANYVEFYWKVPTDIDTAVDVRLGVDFLLGNTDTGTHRYVASSVSVAASAVPTASTLANAVNLDFAGDGSGASGDYESVALTTATSWAAALTAGQVWRIRLARDGNDAADASTVNSTILNLLIEYGSTQ